MIGIIPAAGAGLRIQPLGCSKELLPVGSRDVGGTERPKAVSEYLVERMIAAGARRICMVISAEKSDIVRYYAERDYAAEIFYVVQQRPRGLCDALFRAEPFVRSDEPVLIGLPDTIWFPENAFHASVEQGPGVSLVLFPGPKSQRLRCRALRPKRPRRTRRSEAGQPWIALDMGSCDRLRPGLPGTPDAVGIAPPRG
jgi:glucose-1-phosphate thymidylyltransferase